jgi:hypothetical protein
MADIQYKLFSAPSSSFPHEVPPPLVSVSSAPLYLASSWERIHPPELTLLGTWRGPGLSELQNVELEEIQPSSPETPYLPEEEPRTRDGLRGPGLVRCLGRTSQG